MILDEGAWLGMKQSFETIALNLSTDATLSLDWSPDYDSVPISVTTTILYLNESASIVSTKVAVDLTVHMDLSINQGSIDMGGPLRVVTPSFYVPSFRTVHATRPVRFYCYCSCSCSCCSCSCCCVFVYVSVSVFVDVS